MTSTGLEAAMPSGCAVFDHRYVGPIPGYNFNDFSICAVLDAGSQLYFSGIRVVLVCKACVQELKDLSIHPTSPGRFSATEPLSTSTPLSDKDQTNAEPTEKPLCTLVYEIFDSSDATWDRISVSFRPDAHFDDPEFRILYTHTERHPISPPSSDGCTSVMLFLSCSKSFRGFLKPSSGIRCAYPACTGITALGARILPPPSTRSAFKQPPPEILTLIFRAVLDNSMYKYYAPWRGMFISLGLVCRAWCPALALLYEDFSEQSAGKTTPDIIALAEVLEKRPYHGQAIRRLSAYHFIERSPVSPTSSYKQKSRAFVHILQKAPLVAELDVMDVHAEHVSSLKHALCKCTAVRDFSINQPPPFDGWEGHSGKLSMADLVECVSHWPRLKSLMILGLSEESEPLSSDSAVADEELPIPIQAQKMYLQDSRVMDHELLRISSFVSLEDVTLFSISGLTNAGLRNWLESAGRSLRSLVLAETALTRETDDEEWAIDATIANMPYLLNLTLQGAIFSELVFMRRERTRETGARISWSRITVNDVPPGTFGAHFLTVLKYTGWRDMYLWGAFSHDHDLGEEAKKTARDHGVQLYI